MRCVKIFFTSHYNPSPLTAYGTKYSYIKDASDQRIRYFMGGSFQRIEVKFSSRDYGKVRLTPSLASY